MKPYAELLEFNQPNPIRKPGFTRIRDAFPGLAEFKVVPYPMGDSDGTLNFGAIHDPERIVEFAGRWDYGEKNAAKLGEMSKMKVQVDWGFTGPAVATAKGSSQPIGPIYEEREVPIIQKYIDMGHQSMLEMADATFFIECSRVVSHELVRHRVASYQQESQRFVKYDDTDEDMFYDDGLDKTIYEDLLAEYNKLRKAGVSPQIARYVLPNATRTRLVMKTNLREWRHIIGLRLDKSAQPEMVELMQQVYDQLVDVFPNILYGVNDGGRKVR